MAPDILCIGEPLIEFRHMDAKQYIKGYGGDVSNCCIAASRMGARSGIFTLLGDDEFGDDLVELWQKQGVYHDEVIRLHDGETGLYFIHYRHGNHEFTYRRKNSAASRLQPEHIGAANIEKAKVLHVSGISQAISDSACTAIGEAVAIAKQNSVLVCYDLNFRPRLCSAEIALRNLENLLDKVDILIPSIEDICLLYQTDDHEAVLAKISRQVPVIALTMGKEGAMIIQGDKRQLVEAIKVEPLDATGAGDIFDGSFLAEYIRHEDPLKAARFANVAAAISTTRHGAVDSMPTRKEVEAIVETRA